MLTERMGQPPESAAQAAEFASGVGEAKLAYDFLTYFGAVGGCALDILQ